MGLSQNVSSGGREMTCPGRSTPLGVVGDPARGPPALPQRLGWRAPPALTRRRSSRPGRRPPPRAEASQGVTVRPAAAGVERGVRRPRAGKGHLGISATAAPPVRPPKQQSDRSSNQRVLLSRTETGYSGLHSQSYSQQVLIRAQEGAGGTGDRREAETTCERLGEGTAFPALSGFGSGGDTEETGWGRLGRDGSRNTQAPAAGGKVAGPRTEGGLPAHCGGGGAHEGWGLQIFFVVFFY